MNLEKIDELIASCENGIARVTREDLVAVRGAIVLQQAETARLDVLGSLTRWAVKYELNDAGDRRDRVTFVPDVDGDYVALDEVRAAFGKPAKEGGKS